MLDAQFLGGWGVRSADKPLTYEAKGVGELDDSRPIWPCHDAEVLP